MKKQILFTCLIFALFTFLSVTHQDVTKHSFHLRSPSGLPFGYKSLSQIYLELSQTQLAFPHIAKVIDVTKEYGPGSTIEGRPIFAIKISDHVHVDEDKPNILILATTHAREVINAEICLHIIRELTTKYNVDPVITRIVKENQIWIIPVHNPDGYNYMYNVDREWRKNRRITSNITVGVDLNRNFNPSFYSECGGNTSLLKNTYRGPFPFSEAETQTIVNMSRRLNFAKVLDLHSQGQSVYVSYGKCSKMPSILNEYIIDRAKKFAKLANYKVFKFERQEAMHVTFQYKEITSFAFLVETGKGVGPFRHQPPFTECKKEVRRVSPLIFEFLKHPIPVYGHVFDKESRKPIKAFIEVQEAKWENGETRFSDPKFGRYNLFLPDGIYHLTFFAPGYANTTLRVNVNNRKSFTLNVFLSKLKF